MFFNAKALTSVILVAISLFFKSISASVFPVVEHKPTPDWVKEVKFSENNLKYLSEITKGEYYLLVDEQVNNLTSRQDYRHFAIKLYNENAVENNSRITINFSPDFQTLEFHGVTIWRNGLPLKQVIKNKVKLLQREKELENLIYDGRWTATLLLDDIRKGDVLEYSYTIKGQNPAFNNHHSEMAYLQWEVPVALRHFRLLWPHHLPITITAPDKIKKEIQISKQDSFSEYSITLDQHPSLQIPSETPAWFDPWDRVTFSSTPSWSQVVQWAIGFYEIPSKVPSQHQSLISKIKKNHKTKLEQISAALHFVQDEVRYVGIEVGAGGYIPSSVNDTLNRRYGDCKDKTFLLLTMLDALDVEAYPVLANTSYGENLNEDGPRLDAFNHVLVKVILDNKAYWLETTKNNQSSTIDKIYQPDYGQALVLSPKNESLSDMRQEQPYHISIYEDVFDARKGIDAPATFMTKMTLTGERAEKFRQNLNNKGKKKLAKEYLNFYRNYYKETTSVAEIEISDNKEINQVIVSETYNIENFWSKNNTDQKHYATFYSNSISSYINKPKEPKRSTPFKFSHPVNISHKIKVMLPNSWNLDNETKKIETPFFNFTYKSSYEKHNNILNLEYHYNSLTKHINANEIKKYLSAVKQVEDLLQYSIYIKQGVSSIPHQNTINENVVLIILACILSILLLYTYIEFRINQKHVPDNECKYYPVASIKVFILSIITYGGYLIYWFYKNWHYVKKRDKSTIIPWGRALFYYFWLYPLYKSFHIDIESKNSNPSKATNYKYIVLAIAFLLTTIISNVENIASYIALILSASLILPMVEKINHATLTTAAEHYSFNSKWRPRHYIFGFIFLTFALTDISSRLYIIPSDEVVSADTLWENDIKYMHRIGVLSPSDQLVLFYSDDLFSIRNDGNGLSNNGVFSFWTDKEAGTLHTEKANFSEIAKVKYNNNPNGANTIQVTRKDGSYFVLYVNNSKRYNFYIEMERYREAYKKGKTYTLFE